MISEVYNANSYVIANAKEDIRSGNASAFSNMPRNVYHNRNAYNDTTPLVQRDHLDIAPAFLLHVATRNPDYSFYVKTRTGYTDKNEERIFMRDIYVLDGDEAIGHISRGQAHSNNADGLEFTNNRIRQYLKRGVRKKTAKLSTAKSIFAKYFYGMTLREHMESVAADVGYEVRNALYNMQSENVSAESKLISFLRGEVKQGNQPVLTCIKNLGEASLVDSYNATREAIVAAGNLEKSITDRKGYYVMLKNDEYIRWHKGDSNALDQPKRLKREEMPENMRMALGLLKLAEVKTFVHEAGFKLADNKFFLLDEVQLEFDN